MGIPVIDISHLRTKLSESSTKTVSNSIASACQEYGFFMVKNHGISINLLNDILKISRQFFASPNKAKMKISMNHSGLSWRGYFPPGHELTANLPDAKEGLYFGREEGVNYQGDERVPLTGPNQFPKNFPSMRPLVLSYLKELESLAQDLMTAFAIALLGYNQKDYFRLQFRDKPTILFRLFNYLSKHPGSSWGVGEHTDYGFLTLLYQDQIGGLQVKTLSNDWIDVDPLPETFVVNIGDMMEFWSEGRFIATPHRVKPPDSGRDRISMPFFFDPAFDAILKPIPSENFLPLYQKVDLPKEFKRWDGMALNTNIEFPFKTYGDYLWHKVSQVFPKLASS
ncbi:MAG: isopenicillin N synthase family dioxygenase [Oligoflexales bacterium]